MLTSVERLLFVRGVPIFKELRDDFLVRLASIMDEVAFPANHTIFTQGQEGRSLYIVVSGQVRVHLKDQELAQLAKGTCFGEMSLFDAEPRSASVTAIEPCECLLLTQQQLYEAIDETPGIAINIIRLLSRRIRELNQDLNHKKQQALDASATLSAPQSTLDRVLNNSALPEFGQSAAASTRQTQVPINPYRGGDLPY